MQPVTISAREIFEQVQRLLLQQVVLTEKVDRIQARLDLERNSRNGWWSTAAAWVAVIVVLAKEFLL